MVNKCVAAGCSNGPMFNKFILFKFPRDLAIRMEWTRQVQLVGIQQTTHFVVNILPLTTLRLILPTLLVDFGTIEREG